MLRRVWRPRVLIYGALLTALGATWLWQLGHRSDVDAVLIKDRGALARMVDRGAIENTYRLQVTNSRESARRFRLEVHGLPGLRIDSATALQVEAAGSASVPLRLVLPGEIAQQHAGQSLHVQVRVQPDDAGDSDRSAVQVNAVFIVPR